MRGKILQGRSRMVTRDLFAVANLLVKFYNLKKLERLFIVSLADFLAVYSRNNTASHVTVILLQVTFNKEDRM